MAETIKQNYSIKWLLASATLVVFPKKKLIKLRLNARLEVYDYN